MESCINGKARAGKGAAAAGIPSGSPQGSAGTESAEAPGAGALSCAGLIGRYPPVTHEEAMELFGRKGTPEWKDARDRLVLGNLRLVASIAAECTGLKGAALEDAVSQGVIGLIRAIDGFDPGSGNRFSTYAYWWIRKEAMAAAVQSSRQMIRRPERVARLSARLDRIQSERERDSGRRLSADEAAEELGITGERAEMLFGISGSGYVFSLDAPMESGDAIAGNVASDEDLEGEAVERLFAREAVRAASRLPFLERQAVALRFGFTEAGPLTLKQCAKLSGCSDESIRRFLDSALKELRRGFGGEEGAA